MTLQGVRGSLIEFFPGIRSEILLVKMCQKPALRVVSAAPVCVCEHTELQTAVSIQEARP